MVSGVEDLTNREWCLPMEVNFTYSAVLVLSDDGRIAECVNGLPNRASEV